MRRSIFVNLLAPGISASSGGSGPLSEGFSAAGTVLSAHVPRSRLAINASGSNPFCYRRLGTQRAGLSAADFVNA